MTQVKSSPASGDFRRLRETLGEIARCFERTPSRFQTRLHKTYLARYVRHLCEIVRSKPFSYPADETGSTCTPVLIVNLRRVSLEILDRWDIRNGGSRIDDRPLEITSDELQMLHGAASQLDDEIAKAERHKNSKRKQRGRPKTKLPPDHQEVIRLNESEYIHYRYTISEMTGVPRADVRKILARRSKQKSRARGN